MYIFNIEILTCRLLEADFHSRKTWFIFYAPVEKVLIAQNLFNRCSMEPENNKKKELSTNNRQAAFLVLWSKQQSGDLKDGSFGEVAKLFGVHKSTISRLWRAMNKKIEDNMLEAGEAGDGEFNVNQLLTDMEFFRSGKFNRGRPKKWDRSTMKEEIRRIPLGERTNWRALSVNVGIPKSTLHDMRRQGTFKRHSSALKPRLTEENKLARIEHVLEEIDPTTIDGRREAKYKNMHDRVDVDEKWFYLTRDGARYILTDVEDGDENHKNKEDEPTRRVRHKGYVTKVLFFCAQARPRWDPNRNQMWDGKLGLWPVGKWRPAARTSVNRPAGTLVWENETVDRTKYRQILLQQVVPAIKDKWPRGTFNASNFIIRIQQDGAGAHIRPDDELFEAGLQELGMQNKVLLYSQPANSPDTNINDLGFFRALQSLYERRAPKDVNELIEYVQETYNDYSYAKINKIWLSLMAVYNKILEHHGDNNFQLPHLGKDRLTRLGQLPDVLEVSEIAYDRLADN